MEIIVPHHILEGLHAVREAGTFNMFDIESVKVQAVALGYPDTTEWIEANRDLYTEGIFQGFQAVNDYDRQSPSVLEGSTGRDCTYPI